MSPISAVHRQNFHLQTDVNRAMSPAGRGAVVRLIEPDNSSSGTQCWELAVGRRPYAVFLAHENRFRTVAIDLDATKTDADGVAEDAEVIRALLASAGIDFVSSLSSGLHGTGGRHLIATFNMGGVPARHVRRLADWLKTAAKIASLDTSMLENPSEGCIRPPYSPHRLGGWSTPEAGEDEVVSVLERGNEPTLMQDLVDALPRSRATRQVVRVGAERARSRTYKSGSEAVHGLALHCVNRRMSFREFEKVARSDAADEQVRAALDKRDRDGRGAAWLRRSFSRAMAYERMNPVAPGSTMPEADVVAEWASAVEHHFYVFSDAERRMALVLARRALASGSALQFLAARTAAEAANLSASAASQGLRALQQRGALDLAYRGGPRSAHGYRLVLPQTWVVGDVRTGASTHPLKGREAPVPELQAAADLANDFASDVWIAAKSGGLGERSRVTYRAAVLLADPVTLESSIGDLSTLTGVSDGSATRHLKSLQDAGLAHGVGRGRWVPEVRSADDLARALGVDGTIVARRERHRRQRQWDLVSCCRDNLAYRFANAVEISLRNGDLAEPGADSFTDQSIVAEMVMGPDFDRAHHLVLEGAAA